MVGIWTRQAKWRMTIGAYLGNSSAMDRFQEGANARTLEMWTAKLPDSTLASVRGMRLDDVIEHPRMKGSGATIKSARNERGQTVLAIAAAQIALRDPPAGIGTPWMTITQR